MFTCDHETDHMIGSDPDFWFESQKFLVSFTVCQSELHVSVHLIISHTIFFFLRHYSLLSGLIGFGLTKVYVIGIHNVRYAPIRNFYIFFKRL